MTANWNGQRLKEARVIRGFTHTELAKELEVSFYTVARWENTMYDNNPTLEQMMTICRVLNFPTKFFLQKDNFEDPIVFY